jgi:outer membrane immunogenic protein
MKELLMKKTRLTTAALALALSAGSALAADLPSKKAPPYMPPPPPPPMWTGFYVGLNAGYTFGGSDSVYVATYPGFLNPLLPAFPFNASQAAAATSASGILSPTTDGFIGGGQIGYNWQFNNSFVVGIEADIQGSGARGSAYGIGTGANGFIPGFGTTSTLSVTKNLDYLGTVRGRLGWLATPTLLAYATGGLAYGGVKTSVSINSFDTPFNPFFPVGGGYPGSIGNFSDTRVGWTVGGGLEWMFMPNFSAKVEYLYYDLGSYSFDAGVQTNVSIVLPGRFFFQNYTQASTRYNGHIVRAGVNYHFNWGAPAPVVAKY